MPVKKCSNGKWQIGTGPCVFTSKEKAEKAYQAYLAKKGEDSDIEDARRGKYYQCKQRLLQQGYSEHEAESACSKYLTDDDDLGTYGEDWNLQFVDSDDITIEDRLHIFSDEHPDWSHDQKVAAAQAYDTLSKYQDAEIINILKRSTSLSLSRFSTLIKALKTRLSLKAPHMGILPMKIILPMKNLNRLQTKLEKLVTQEQKWLTAEQYEQRKQYAKYMRKADAEESEISDLEFTEMINDLYLEITDYFPNDTSEDAIEKAFMPPKGDNAWVLSDEAEIVSMNDGLNNVIKAPIILAKEMVQTYVNENGEVEYHYKAFSELKDAAERIGIDGSLDIIIEHQDWYDAEHIMGKVKQIRTDEKSRTLRGMGYFYENRLPDGLKKMIKDGEIVGVSIGFLAKLGEGGVWNGIEYNFAQKQIHLRHLAICLDSVPRCPEGVCGINLKDASEDNKTKEFIIIKKPNYYINICKLLKDSETENNKESNIIKQEEKTMHEDSEGKIKGDEPDDLEAILSRLRKFIEGKVLDENITARILSAIGIKKKGDSIMDEKEFQDAIAAKESEIEELKTKFEDALKTIEEFKEKEKLNLIKKIKKFGDKYSDEELQKKDLNTLHIIADAFSKFEPSSEKAEVLPLAGQDSKEELEEKLKEEEHVDFSKTFEDVNKQFWG